MGMMGSLVLARFPGYSYHNPWHCTVLPDLPLAVLSIVALLLPFRSFFPRPGLQ